MPSNPILREAGNLRKVSESLNLLAKEHTQVAEALAVLSGAVRNSAALLEVLVTLRLDSESQSGSKPEPQICLDKTSN
jgi:hypothetical protein